MEHKNTKYAYSLKTERIKEPDFPYDNKKITGAADVYNFIKKIQNSDVEKFVTIFLSQSNKIIGVNIVSGTLNCVFPIAREIFKNALLFQAAAIILAHNHPSGSLTPSAEDRKFTDNIASGGKILGVVLLDHIIVGENNFMSFADKGML